MGTKTKNGASVESQAGGFRAMMSTIMQRASWSSLLGKSYKGNRDLYETLGYKDRILFEDHWGLYRRQDIAKRIVNAPVDACWRIPPTVTDMIEERPEEDYQSEFEKAWEALVKRLRINQYLARADKLARAGHYSVLLLGVNDGKDPAEPLERLPEGTRQLMYLAPFRESNATISSWIADPKSPKFGFPEAYWLKYTDDESLRVRDPGKAHHTRVLHIAEDLVEDDVYGIPVLDAVFNRLQDLEKVVGGAAEMFWRGARKEYVFSEREGSDYDTSIQSDNDLTDEIDKFVHDMQNYMRLSGVDVKSINPAVSNPRSHVDVIVDLIAGATGIPKRILLGSERGELASSQDETNWNERIAERREQHVVPNILRPFIDYMIELGVLPEPESGEYDVDFASKSGISAIDASTVAKNQTDALARYADSLGASEVVPPDFYLREILGLTQEQVDKINSQIEAAVIDEERDQPAPGGEEQQA